MEDKDLFLLEFPKFSPFKPLNGSQKESESHKKGPKFSNTPQIAITVPKNSLNTPYFRRWNKIKGVKTYFHKTTRSLFKEEGD